MEFKTPQQQQQNSTVSMAISEEIARFESVHRKNINKTILILQSFVYLYNYLLPLASIYAIYELIEHLEDVKLAAEIRENVVQIEGNLINL